MRGRRLSVGIGATLEEETDTLVSETETNSESGPDEEDKREDIGAVGTAKGMAQ